MALSLTIVGGKAYAIQADQNVKTAEVDSTLIKPYIAKIEAYKDLLKDAEKDANKQADELKSQIKNLNDRISNLESENNSLKQTIKDFEDIEEKYNRDLISGATYYLFIPYEEYIINGKTMIPIKDIVIRNFKKAEGSKAYEERKNRLPLLENYKSDIDTIKAFLGNVKKEYFGIADLQSRAKAPEKLKELKELVVYKRYQTYPDWKATYLGGKIVKIEAILNRPSAQTYSELMKVKEELENSK